MSSWTEARLEDAIESHLSTNASSTSTVSSTKLNCNTCSTPSAMTPLAPESTQVTFHLNEGDFLHDLRPTDMSISCWAQMVAASSVHRLFYAYTEIITRDSHRCSSSFHANSPENRYRDIPLIEKNRVIVKPSSSTENDYYHANYVDGFRETSKYILTQSPLLKTISKFWNMVWQNNCVMIVAMDKPDSHHYPAKSGDTLQVFQGFTVSNIGVNNTRQTFDSNLLQLNRNNETRRVCLLQYWDVKEPYLPQYPHLIFQLLMDIRHTYQLLRRAAANWLPESESSPWLLYDRSGVGLSAVIATLDISAAKMDAGAKARGKAVASCDVMDTVLRLRSQRALAINKPQLYVLCVLCALEYAIRRKHLPVELANQISLDNFALFFD